MKIYNILSAIILVLAFTSCENEIPFDIKDNPPKLVVNTMIDIDRDRNYIYLCKTGKNDIDSIDNAIINIYVNEELKEQITEHFVPNIDYGDYDENNPVTGSSPFIDYGFNKQYKTELRFQPGDKVKIEVFADNDKYHAWAEDIIPTPIEIDNIDTMAYIENYEHRIRLKTTFTDSPNKKNFYRIAVVQKNTLHIKNIENGAIFFDYHEESLYMDSHEDIILSNGKIPTESEFVSQEKNQYMIFDDTHLNGTYTMTTSFYRPNYTYNSPYISGGILDRVSIDFHVHLISITDMQYFYLKALNIISSDSYDEYLSMPIPLPSNVIGGVGFVGFSSGTHRVFSIPDIIPDPNNGGYEYPY